jgi:GDPmannose 4,6-dehydratase
MSEKKIAYITGISGQDSSYLSELLLSKSYIVYGMIRRNSSEKYPNIEHIRDKLNLIYGDVTDSSSIVNALNTIIRNEGKDIEIFIFNMAAMSHVKTSYEIPVYTSMVDGIGTLNVLEAIRSCELKDRIKFYQASTSELYGKNSSGPQNEDTPMIPTSPYAISKLYSYWIVKNYRECYNIFAVNGILFNHTSIRRPDSFVCRKIAQACARINSGKQECLYLGNLNAKRDLGHSKDFVVAMWLMLQQETPTDYVVSMGETYSVRELCQLAWDTYEKKIHWEGEDLNEVGIVDEKIVIRVSKDFFRPSEVPMLLGDSSKARRELGWLPTYTTPEILREMVLHDEMECKK